MVAHFSRKSERRVVIGPLKFARIAVGSDIRCETANTTHKVNVRSAVKEPGEVRRERIAVRISGTVREFAFTVRVAESAAHQPGVVDAVVTARLNRIGFEVNRHIVVVGAVVAVDAGPSTNRRRGITNVAKALADVVRFVAPLDKRHSVVVAECVQRLVCRAGVDIAIVVSSPGVGKSAALTSKTIGTALLVIISDVSYVFQCRCSVFRSIERIVQCGTCSYS